MKITARQIANSSNHEFLTTQLCLEGVERTFFLDINFSEFLDRSRKIETLALDFLFIAAVVYASDKLVSRQTAEDHWGRTIELSVPLQNPEPWQVARESLEDAVSFLTGDSWYFEFTQAGHRFQAVRTNRRRRPRGYPAAPVVTLLSGGLDSFIGAIDALAGNDRQRLLFVSHYDGDLSGPGSDQQNLRILLDSKFPGRISHVQVRVGVNKDKEEENELGKYKFESSFRSRSLIFLGLGLYAARMIGPDTPVAIPENGPIALNLPLTSSRRGACSTRTVHPNFLSLLRKALGEAGIENPISNPYTLKTKGEMVKECAARDVLLAGSAKTTSCGKSGRKTYWEVKVGAKNCGTCVPCLFRRASLHAIGADDETYGNNVFTAPPQKYPDFHALLGVIRSNPTTKEIARQLIANGRLPISDLDNYAAVVRRMLDEVTVWIREKGSKEARQLGGIRNA